MSCKCQRCGNLYKIDLIIPDKLWESIKPQNKAKGAGLLCGECIIKLLELRGNYGALQLMEAANSTSTNKQSLPCYSCGGETENKISLCSNCRHDIWPE